MKISPGCSEADSSKISLMGGFHELVMGIPLRIIFKD